MEKTRWKIEICYLRENTTKMDIDLPEEGRLTAEEIRQLVKGGEKLTDEQIETINDFIALAAVIAYEGLKREVLGLNSQEQMDETWTPSPHLWHPQKTSKSFSFSWLYRKKPLYLCQRYLWQGFLSRPKDWFTASFSGAQESLVFRSKRLAAMQGVFVMSWLVCAARLVHKSRLYRKSSTKT